MLCPTLTYRVVQKSWDSAFSKTDTIEIGLKILPQHLPNQKYIVL